MCARAIAANGICSRLDSVDVEERRLLCRTRAEAKTRPPNFELLDMGGGAGWDLVCKLITERNRFQRGRLSVAQALQHKFFR